MSSIIEKISAEARSYIKDDVVKDIALYEGSADLINGRQFVSDFIEANKNNLPKVFVVDIAFSERIGWFILEFNACWGAGLNNCRADKILDCIIDATINN